jgi:FtsZ-binding cell division protein ZapB
MRGPDDPPRCYICGEYIEGDQAPLCEAHDTETARERVQLDMKVERVSERVAHMQMERIEQGKGNQSERVEKLNREIEAARGKIEELQEECEHLRAEREVRQYREGDLRKMPEEEMPSELPVYDVVRMCWECGWRDTVEYERDRVFREILGGPETTQLADGPEGPWYYRTLDIRRVMNTIWVRDVDGVVRETLEVPDLSDHPDPYEALREEMDEINERTLSRL